MAKPSVKKDRKIYTAETLQIMEDSGLQNGYHAYSDPIYQSYMMGNFYRSLFYSSHHTIIKLIVSIFLLFPASVIVYQTWITRDSLLPEEIWFGSIGFIVIEVPMLLAGFILLRQAILEIRNRYHEKYV